MNQRIVRSFLSQLEIEEIEMVVLAAGVYTFLKRYQRIRDSGQ